MSNSSVDINNDSGIIKFRDINHNFIVDNLSRNLDIVNKEWISNNRNLENSIISNLLLNKSKILDISKQNLYFKNTFFKNEKVYFEDIYVPLEIHIDKKIRSLKDNKPVINNLYYVDDNFLVEDIF